MTPPQVIAAVIFIGTIAAMVVRPRGTSEWVWAVTGAVLMIFAGVEPVQLAARAIAARYDVLLFFAGLMVIIAVAEQAGFFGWIAYRAALTARGSQSRLFLAVIAYGAIVAAFLTNDAAALVMTPLIYAFARTMRLSAMPFAFACTFIANGASLALPISNPVNFIIAQAAGLHLFDYLRLLWLPAIVSTSLTGAMLVWVFRRDVRGRFDASQTTVTCSNPRYRLEVTVLLAAAAAALLGAAALGAAVGLTASLAACVLILHALSHKELRCRSTVRGANPSILVLVAALFALVDGLRHSGLLSAPTAGIAALTAWRPEATAPLAGLASALAANVFNNLPTSIVIVAMLHGGQIPAALDARFAAGAIAGCDLGPNFTTVGSLSTMLWLALLRKRGVQVSALDYFKVSAIMAPVVLIATFGALWITAH